MLKLDEEVLNRKVLNPDEFRPIVIAFLASWCPRCRAWMPTLEELAEELDGRALVVAADIDEQKELAERFDVSDVPTLLLIQNGKVKSESVGIRSKPELLGWIF